MRLKIIRKGTSSKFEESIKNQIMLPKGNNFNSSAQLGEGFYVAVGKHEVEIANFFARIAVENTNADLIAINNENADLYFPVLLRVKCQDFHTLKGLVIPRSLHWADLPWIQLETHAEYVKEFDYIVSFVTMGHETDSKKWVQVKFNPRTFDRLEAE